MSKYTRILCPVIFALLSAPTFADHVNISDWDISVVMHKIPDPNDCDCAAANPADPMRTLRDGVEYNNISAQSAINACEPIAYLSRAEIELGQDTPNFTQIIDDLGRAEKGNISVAITWAQLHEKMGEHMLTSNQSCVAGHCGKKIATMSEYEMLFTFNYHGLRAYYGALEAALNFYHDYMRSHPTNAFASDNITRLEDRLEMLNPMIKSKLDDLYR